MITAFAKSMFFVTKIKFFVYCVRTKYVLNKFNAWLTVFISSSSSDRQILVSWWTANCVVCSRCPTMVATLQHQLVPLATPPQLLSPQHQPLISSPVGRRSYTSPPSRHSSSRQRRLTRPNSCLRLPPALKRSKNCAQSVAACDKKTLRSG